MEYFPVSGDPSQAMAEEKTDVQTSQTTEETETLENDESQTDEDTTTDADGESEDVENKEGESFYEAELKRIQDAEDEKRKKLEEELAETKRQRDIKDRALQAEKKKTKPAAETSTNKDELKREILNEMREEQELERATTNKAERELLKHHLNTTIKRSGDIKIDIQRAWAVTNAARLPELLSRQTQQDEADDSAANSMLSAGYNGQRGPSKIKSPARKIAEEALKNNPAALKNLDKYLPR